MRYASALVLALQIAWGTILPVMHFHRETAASGPAVESHHSVACDRVHDALRGSGCAGIGAAIEAAASCTLPFPPAVSDELPCSATPDLRAARTLGLPPARSPPLLA